MEIVYEDKDIVVVNKPHGLHVVADRHGEQDTTLKSMLANKYGKIWVVHRLDAGTGGLIIFAKNAEAHRFLNGEFEHGKVKKEYIAIVKGCMRGAVTVMLPIAGKSDHGRYRINFKSGKNAITTFVPILFGKESALVKVYPYTGRTHQIRVHLKALKHPLVEDWVYNERTEERRITLFASCLKFSLPDGEMKEIRIDMGEYITEKMAFYGLYKENIDLCNFLLD